MRKSSRQPETVFIFPADASETERFLVGRVVQSQQTLGQIVQLLTQILTHLEAQATTPAVPMATYDAMYADHPIEAGPPEGELVAEALPQEVPPRTNWWRRIFLRSEP